MSFIPRHIALFLCLLISTVGYAQDIASILNGKVIGDDADMAGIYIRNMTANTSTITNAEGDFSILVHLNDLLVFSAVQFKRKELRITPSLMEIKSVEVEMEPFTNKLDEVVVIGNKELPTAVSLGLPNAGVKLLTQGERKLFEADHGKFVQFYGKDYLPTLRINLYKILNRISGRTKKLKKLVARDQRYNRTKEVRLLFADSLFVKQLKIPQEKIADFMYFCEVDATFGSITQGMDYFAILDFLTTKSLIYRKNNHMD